jgi:hypothetical protein
LTLRTFVPLGEYAEGRRRDHHETVSYVESLTRVSGFASVSAIPWRGRTAILKRMPSANQEKAKSVGVAVPALPSGEMQDRISSFDWNRTPIGSLDMWSPALRITVRNLLASSFPQLLWWGPEYISIYKDAYRPIASRERMRRGGSLMDGWRSSRVNRVSRSTTRVFRNRWFFIAPRTGSDASW